ncbi:MAG: hypothetical protein H6908_01925 [Hyphomicrobiales bacterium]|nr:hypothetical protein [Hyphomicrobiales bacterium]
MLAILWQLENGTPEPKYDFKKTDNGLPVFGAFHFTGKGLAEIGWVEKNSVTGNENDPKKWIWTEKAKASSMTAIQTAGAFISGVISAQLLQHEAFNILTDTKYKTIKSTVTQAFGSKDILEVKAYGRDIKLTKDAVRYALNLTSTNGMRDILQGKGDSHDKYGTLVSYYAAMLSVDESGKPLNEFLFQKKSNGTLKTQTVKVGDQTIHVALKDADAMKQYRQAAGLPLKIEDNGAVEKGQRPWKGLNDTGNFAYNTQNKGWEEGKPADAQGEGLQAGLDKVGDFFKDVDWKKIGSVFEGGGSWLLPLGLMAVTAFASGFGGDWLDKAFKGVPIVGGVPGTLFKIASFIPFVIGAGMLLFGQGGNIVEKAAHWISGKGDNTPDLAKGRERTRGVSADQENYYLHQAAVRQQQQDNTRLSSIENVPEEEKKIAVNVVRGHEGLTHSEDQNLINRNLPHAKSNEPPHSPG